MRCTAGIPQSAPGKGHQCTWLMADRPCSRTFCFFASDSFSFRKFCAQECAWRGVARSMWAYMNRIVRERGRIPKEAGSKCLLNFHEHGLRKGMWATHYRMNRA